MTSIAFVVGNGFDLDLGLLTKYSDFADTKNKEWNDFLNMTGTILKQKCPIEYVEHMQNARNYENWFDIEEEIFKFVNKHTNLREPQIGLIRQQHVALVQCLRQYIYRQTISTKIKEDSLANILLHKLCETSHPVGIYTYNYTNCIKLCGCNKRDFFNVHPVHGMISSDDMVLGCRIYNDSTKNEQLDFLYKPIVDITKERIGQNLTQATETIIFGHSMNKIDACYFKDFFGDIERGTQNCKHLTIICKDEKSRETIKKNIQDYVNLSIVERNVDVKYIYTDLWNIKDPVTLQIYNELCHRIS